MLTLLLTSLLSVLPGAEKYGVAILSQKTGNIKASAVLIHAHAALTAAHATDDVGALATLRCPNGIVHGLVTRRSVLLDLSIVAFEEECDTPVAEIASHNAPIGSQVTIVGHPDGAFLTVTSGTISSYQVIQTDAVPRYALLSTAQIFKGNSGGPVLSDEGLLVGMVTGRICFTDTDEPAVCLSSSVPSSLIRLFLQATP